MIEDSNGTCLPCDEELEGLVCPKGSTVVKLVTGGPVAELMRYHPASKKKHKCSKPRASYQTKFRSQASEMKSREEKSREKEKESEERRYGCPKCLESRETVKRCVFPIFVGQDRRVGSLERRVWSDVAREMKNCTLLWRDVHFRFKMYESHYPRTTFLGSDVEKWHAAALKTKANSLAPFLEVRKSEKCRPLWREAYVQVKMHKTPAFWSIFGGSDVEKVSDRWNR